MARREVVRTKGSRTSRGYGGTVPELYEIEITGSIGPLIQSCLPEFGVVVESSWTVLTGTVHGPDDLHRVLDLLHTHGTPAVDIRITPHRDESKPTPQR
jgi:hypothetical protein